jgi:hypothetical protein
VGCDFLKEVSCNYSNLSVPSSRHLSSRRVSYCRCCQSIGIYWPLICRAVCLKASFISEVKHIANTVVIADVTNTGKGISVNTAKVEDAHGCSFICS